MHPSTYGDRIADVYDDWYTGATDVEGTVATVKRLAASVANGSPARVAIGRPASVANGHQGSVLELGIGTGRLAVALLDAGLDVAGIDASSAMLERLRQKVGDRIPVTLADFVDVPVQRTFDVALLAFNALLNLTSEEDQRRCLARCAEVATYVVVETFVPGDAAPSSAVDVRDVTADEVRLSAYRIVDGVVSGSIVSITEAGIRLRPWRVRLTTPSEIDAIAAAAGLALVERASGWRGEPFDDGSDRSMAIYRSARR
jgi:SAM-dependent methyltransferase